MADRKEPPFFNDDSMGALDYKLPFYDPMELFIETLTGTCFELRVLPFEAVVSVKAKIHRLEGIPVAQQHLIWNNLELDDEYCLHDYGIAEGCTLKLVLAMRGGPMNTRRVTMDEPVKEVADAMEGPKVQGREKSAAHKQVTFVVYREGEQLNFFRVVDRGDGTLTPLSENISGGLVYNVYTEEEGEGGGSASTQLSLENSITMHKMRLLKAKMEGMNLNKKPKKLSKLKPRPPGSPHSSGGPSSTRHHHRFIRGRPQLNHHLHATRQLPPIRDHDYIGRYPPSPAAPSPNLSVTRPAPSVSSSPSRYMFHEERPCETGPPFAKVWPPPKLSQLDIDNPRFMRDCVYPQLPPLSTTGSSEGSYEAAEPDEDTVDPSLFDKLSRLVEPTLCGAHLGELPDLKETTSHYQLSSSPTLHSPWTLGTTDVLTSSRADRMNRTLHQPLDSSMPCSQPNLQAQSLTRLSAGNTSSPPSVTLKASPPHLRGVKVESPGRRPEVISKKHARGITKMANQAYKEPLGSLRHSELLASLSTRASGVSSRNDLRQSLGHSSALPPATAAGRSILDSKLPSIPSNGLLHGDLIKQSPQHTARAPGLANNRLASGEGVLASFRTTGALSHHLAPVKAPTGSRKSSKHCFLCGKKTGLATSYECRCGHNFCTTHRYAETHDCTYDYKSSGRRFLQETNPLISAPKLPKI
ncbi:AN1-type zinc finger protein 4 isoform X2 [Genypterus blacodes]|uniref:AN1-type zinc finger protein 4 isoform X2 n=1 Tax=Genypterus blacodes TaxID=154954 RepID=UPI003F75CB7E